MVVMLFFPYTSCTNSFVGTEGESKTVKAIRSHTLSKQNSTSATTVIKRLKSPASKGQGCQRLDFALCKSAIMYRERISI